MFARGGLDLEEDHVFVVVEGKTGVPLFSTPQSRLHVVSFSAGTVSVRLIETVLPES